jgi:nitrogen fixation protein FixH
MDISEVRKESEMQANQPLRHRRVTGRFVLITLVVFFGVITAVNALMATLAIRTFGGIEAENAYRAGLAFSKEITAGRDQKARDLRVEVATNRQSGGMMEFRLTIHNVDAKELPRMRARIDLRHPADRRHDRVLSLKQEGSEFVGTIAVESGGWNLRISLDTNNERIFQSNNRIVIQ